MRLLQIKRVKGFTLVELIIVITILAILATLAFVSFQGYFKTSRDSAKVTTLREYEKGLQTYQIKTGNFPDPENAIDIVGISYQGYVKDNLKKLLNIRSNDTTTSYHYSVTKNKLKYELGVYLEERNTTLFGIISKTYAASDYLKQYFYVLGDSVGILLDKETGTPVQEIYTGSLNLTTNTGTFIAQFKNSGGSGTVSGSGNTLLNNILIVQSSCAPTTYSGYTIPVISYNQSQTVTKSITGGTGSILASCSNNGVLSYGSENITCGNGYVLQSGACMSVGGSNSNPGLSCLDIKTNVPSSTDGVYWIDPDGAVPTISSFQVYCDMTTDGGGWTLLGSAQLGGAGANPINWTIATNTSVTSVDPLGGNTIGSWGSVNSKLQSWISVPINSILVREASKYDKMTFTTTNNFSALLSAGTLSSYTNVTLNFNTCQNVSGYCRSPSIAYALRTPNNQPCSNSYYTSNNQGINLVWYHDGFCAINGASYVNRGFFTNGVAGVKEGAQSTNRISQGVSFWGK